MIGDIPRSKLFPRWACPRRLFGLAATVVTLGLLAGACSGGGTAKVADSRPRPTDTALHDHSGESSAIAPETVRARDIAELGEGPSEGEEFEAFLGINVCGRFLELPERGPVAGLAVDSGGQVSVAPGPGDEVGHDVTVGDLLALMDVAVGTGEMSFGEQWATATAPLDGEETALGGAELGTGDSCGREQGEVQLWYYTAESAESGDDIRMVVTDPQEVPIAADGVAITIAFAPTSSLPTLPPAVMAG